MKTGKVLQWTVSAVIATGAWGLYGTTGASASVTAADIEMSGIVQKLYVNIKGDKELLAGVATKNTKSGKTTFKVSAWDVYEIPGGTGRVDIDLSRLSNVKDNFIAVKTDDMDTPVIIRIPAVDKVSAASYNAAAQELEFKTGESKRSLKAADAYEWRTEYSSWNTPTALQQLKDGKATGVFEEFLYQGTTLYIRTPGGAQAGIKETLDSTLKNAYDAANPDMAVKVYDSSPFPGRETKLNISKQAKGPAVSVQYTFGTITLPKSSEYRIIKFIGDNTVVPDETIKNENVKKGVTVKELLTSAGTGPVADEGILEIRIEENDSRNKCASKWTRIPLVKPALISTSGSDAIVAKPALPTDGLYKWGDGGIKNVKVTGAADASGNRPVLAEAGYVADSKGNYRVVLTNSGDEDYHIVVMDKEALPGSDAKPRALKAGRQLQIANINDGEVIYIREAGDKRTKTWAGEYIKFGTVDFPKQETA